jgi:extradiol dioxygenase family protein
MKTLFHLAFPIKNIEETKKFYKEVLHCVIGRQSKKWVDFDFFGHQLSAHLKPEEITKAKKIL